MTEFVTPQVDTNHPNDNNPEYEKQMVDKADAGLNTGTNQPEKLLAGKYKSEEDLNKGVLEILKKKHGGNLEAAYKELEKTLGTPAAETGEKAPEQKPAGTEEKKDAPQVGGLDFDKYTNEYTSNGGLSEESVQEIVKSGIPEHLLQQYMAGLDAMVQLSRTHAFSITGGEQQYADMVTWAKANMTPAEIQAYNQSLLEPDLAKRGESIKSLYAKYSEANPQLIDGAGGSGSKGDVYQSMEQLKADQRDPRYKQDPAFRDTVMKKLARSKIM